MTTDGLRISKAALFRDLGYTPHPGQLLVHRSKARIRVLACGARWGKTLAAAHEAVFALLSPGSGVLGWVVAPTLDLTDRIFGQVVSALRSKFRHRIKEYDQRSRRISVWNFGGGVSVLQAKTADNPVSLLGEGLNYLIVDEAAMLGREVWINFLSQRLLDRDGWALLCSTPHGKNWFYSLWRRGQRGSDPELVSWGSPSSGNPHLDPKLIEAERGRMPLDVFQEQYEAAFVGTSEDPCGLCEGPSADVPRTVVIQEGEELPRCPECEGCTDAFGHTVVSLGPDGPCLIILVESGMDETPEPLPDGAEGPIPVLNGTLTVNDRRC